MDIRERVYHFAVTNYKLIDSKDMIYATLSLSNSSCHVNAVAAKRAGRADRVWLVWGGGKEGCVHFINSLNGKFFDETWHDYNLNQQYRIIREVKESEFEDIYDLLVSAKIALVSAVGNPWQRFNVTRNPHKYC